METSFENPVLSPCGMWIRFTEEFHHLKGFNHIPAQAEWVDSSR